MRILNEEEINKDLKYNFPGQGVTLESFVDIDNPFLVKSKEEARLGYTCGYLIRDFLSNNKVRLTFASRELLPVVFNVTGVREIYEVCGYGRGPKGLDDLREIGVIEFVPFLCRRVVFYLNNFEHMKKSLKGYAYKKGIGCKRFGEKFENEFGSIKPYANQISERSLEVYKSSKEWFENHKGLNGFKFDRRPLSLDYEIEEKPLVLSV